MKKIIFIKLLLFQIIISCSTNESENTNNGNVTNSSNSNSTTTYSYTEGAVVSYGSFSSPTIITSCKQTWMKENLKAVNYRNGDPIPQVSDPTQWAGLTTGAYCEYPLAGNIYGKLYNWYAVTDPRGLAPKGWHIPTKLEWENLSNCLGGYLVAGEKMKEVGTSHWISQPNPGNNISGFTAFGGGLRSSSGSFVNLKQYGVFWSTTQFSADRANNCLLSSNSKYLFFNDSDKKSGYSIRCVKD